MLESRHREGKPCEPLETKPEDLYIPLQMVWDAFWTLNRTRHYSSVSGEPLPLSLTEIKAYLDLFPVYDVKSFVDEIYVLDQEYLRLDRVSRDKSRSDNQCPT